MPSLEYEHGSGGSPVKSMVGDRPNSSSSSSTDTLYTAGSVVQVSTPRSARRSKSHNFSHYHPYHSSSLPLAAPGGPEEEDGEGDGIWPADVEQAFRDAYEIFPNYGRSKIKGEDGRLYGRNELISKYIWEKTGKLRTRKQVSSHIQVLVKKGFRHHMELPLVTPQKTPPGPAQNQYPTPASCASSPKGIPATTSTVYLIEEARLYRIESRVNWSTPTPPSKQAAKKRQQQQQQQQDQQTNMLAAQQRRTSVDMILSAAIYMDQEHALDLPEVSAVLPEHELQIRAYDIHTHPAAHVAYPSAYAVRCQLVSPEALEVEAVTQVYSFGSRVLEFTQNVAGVMTGLDDGQHRVRSEGFIYTLDQSPLAEFLLRTSSGSSETSSIWEGIYIRLKLKWKPVDAMDQDHDHAAAFSNVSDHYFVIKAEPAVSEISVPLSTLTLCYVPTFLKPSDSMNLLQRQESRRSSWFGSSDVVKFSGTYRP